MTILHKSAALLAMAGAVLFATAAPATAAPTVAAATPVVFDLNGTYSDFGSARPVIRQFDDILIVDMSSLRRPNANGVVINSDTIRVTFPDDATFTARLQAPGTIRWSNGSAWTKTPAAVPSVILFGAGLASAVLSNAGFQLGSATSEVDPTCTHIGVILQQSPAAGALALPGTAVNVALGVFPPTLCP